MALLNKNVSKPVFSDAPSERKRPSYAVNFARSEEEVRAALRLRFNVFNLELNEGLAASHATGMDEDEFDAVCDHLIVTEEGSGEVVGTYRMQTGTMAGVNLGYYSACEFDFAPFEPVRDSMVELGRACVHRDHRSIAVISMLWKEIVRYALDRKARYLIGCSSLTSQDPAHGWAVYNRFVADGCLAERMFRTAPLPSFVLESADPMIPCPPPPKLLRAYLGIGAKICSIPAIDRAFGTIDFLTMIDCFNADATATGRFVERPNGISMG
jgi:putative hemolysin